MIPNSLAMIVPAPLKLAALLASTGCTGTPAPGPTSTKQQYLRYRPWIKPK